MCLSIKKTDVVMDVMEDIVCYKCVLMVYDHHTGEFVYDTVFMDYRITFGDVHESSLKREPDLVTMGFHSFANLEDAKQYMAGLNLYCIKCIIPKGAQYYIGTFANLISYASNKIIFVEETQNGI